MSNKIFLQILLLFDTDFEKLDIILCKDSAQILRQEEETQFYFNCLHNLQVDCLLHRLATKFN